MNVYFIHVGPVVVLNFGKKISNDSCLLLLDIKNMYLAQMYI